MSEMVEQRQMPLNRIPGPAGPRPITTSAALTPKEVFGIFRRHILLIVFLPILGLVVGGVTWYLLLRYAPKYTAQTYIRVLPPIEKDPMTIVGGQVGRDIQYGYRVSMAALMKQQSTLLDLLKRDKVQETNWFKSFGKIRAVRIEKAFKNLKKRFNVIAQRDGEFAVVSMTSGNGKEAALIVNEMVDLFVASQGGSKKAEIAARLAKLESQRLSVQRDLDLAERGLDEVRSRWGFTDLEERNFQHTVTMKLNDLEFQQSEQTLNITQFQAQIANLDRQARGPVSTQVEHEIERDPVMLTLAQQLASQGIALAGVLTKFGENHRITRRVQEQISEIKVERAARKMEIAEQTRQANFQNAQDTLLVLKSRLEELEKMRAGLEARKRDLDLARVQYERRVNIRDERMLMLNAIKQQVEKLRIVHDDPETIKVRRIGDAPEPLEVSSPKWQFYFPSGTFMGLIFGIGLAFLIELLNDLVRTPRDVGRYLHIPLLGVIPDADEDEQVRDIDLCHVVRQAPYSIISESYRCLRTNLKLSSSADSLKALLVSSGMAGDGKTSVAVNLATTFVAENKKVLLIDANFWRPSLHDLFPKPQAQGPEPTEQSNFGLSNLLMGQCGSGEIIRASGVEGLYLIGSGPLPPNPAELLGGPRMKELIKQQRDNYDYIIVDGPPVLVVSATKMLARLVDGTILVFNAGATRRGAAQRTIRELRQVNAAIVGCVVFAVKAMKGGYFTEQFRSYQDYQKLQLARSI